jgi:hypothetical protein
LTIGTAIGRSTARLPDLVTEFLGDHGEAMPRAAYDIALWTKGHRRRLTLAPRRALIGMTV